jgi:cellulase/cellobiase CelA1
MRYTVRERRFAVLAAVMAVAAALPTLYLLRGSSRPPDPGQRAAWPGQTAVSPASRPATAARALKAEYSIRNRWKDGFNAEVTITNIGSQPIEGWIVRLRLPEGVRVTQAWSADVTQSPDTVTLKSQPWNTYLGPGAGIRVGFEATGTAAAPASCTVNGMPC